MICEEARAFLQDHVDGALSEAARGVVEQHLSGCADCSGEHRALSEIHERLKAEPMLDPPEGFARRAMARIFPAQKFSFRREILRIAAAVLVTLGLTLTLTSLDYDEIFGAENVESVKTMIPSIPDVYNDLLEDGQ